MDFNNVIQEIESANDAFSCLENVLDKDGPEDEEVVKSLKQRIEFYKQQNAEMEGLIQKFKGLDHLSGEAKTTLDELVSIQEKFGCKDIGSESVLMSGFTLTERVRKQESYIARMKMAAKAYTALNEKLSNDINFYKRELESSEVTLEKLRELTPAGDLKAMEIKVRNYEKELTKFETKYPWLKSPTTNILTILNEIDVLNSLRAKKEALQEDLVKYEGLKPDIVQAQEQLKDVKQQYSAFDKCNKRNTPLF